MTQRKKKDKRHRFLRVRTRTYLIGGQDLAKVIALTAATTATQEATRDTYRKLGKTLGGKRVRRKS